MSNYQIRADVFPVLLTLTDDKGDQKIYDKARIILTLDHVYVFMDSQPKPEIVFEDRLVSYTPPIAATRVRKPADLLNRNATFTTEEGYEGSFLRTGGCGCGSRMKKMSASELLPNGGIAQAASSNDSV